MGTVGLRSKELAGGLGRKVASPGLGAYVNSAVSNGEDAVSGGDGCLPKLRSGKAGCRALCKSGNDCLLTSRPGDDVISGEREAREKALTEALYDAANAGILGKGLVTRLFREGAVRTGEWRRRSGTFL